MSFPTNCVMCTIGHFLDTGSYGAAGRTDGMDGPPYDEEGVSMLLMRCGLSVYGTFQRFGTFDEACSYMLQHAGEYALGMHGAGMGHMIAVDSHSGMLEFTDAQAGTNGAPTPTGACSVWRVDPTMGKLVGGMKGLRI
ncbi:MAG TPA: hypothetical protein VM694_17215 [Polyangium sp.]|jgi:hypothetical protein|nr:hypothetical protein [Polyangium sp.]